MDQQTVPRHISKRVALDKGGLTYRTLSRELGLTVAEAKTHLALYAKEPATAERGVKVTWALSGWLLPEEAPAKEEPMDVDPSQADSQPQSQTQVEDDAPQAKRRGIVLCTDDRLQAESARFSPAPSKHVYALSPSAPTLSTLAASSSLAHASTSKAAGDDESSWKPAPEGGYGTITHPDGSRKRTAPAKGAKQPVKPTTAPTAAAQKAGAAKTTDVKGKGKEAAKSGGMAGFFDKPKKAAAPVRPIGQLGGLFASRDPPPAAKEKEGKKGKDKVVPSKRKAEEKEKEKPKEKAKPVKKQSNGIFDDEMDDDDEGNEDDEAAMREIEETESQEKSSKGSSSKTDAAKQKKDLEATLFSDDDDKMVVNPPAKKAPAPAKAKKEPLKKQATLSFLKK